MLTSMPFCFCGKRDVYWILRVCFNVKTRANFLSTDFPFATSISRITGINRYFKWLLKFYKPECCKVINFGLSLFTVSSLQPSFTSLLPGLHLSDPFGVWGIINPGIANPHIFENIIIGFPVWVIVGLHIKFYVHFSVVFLYWLLVLRFCFFALLCPVSLMRGLVSIWFLTLEFCLLFLSVVFLCWLPPESNCDMWRC